MKRELEYVIIAIFTKFSIIENIQNNFFLRRSRSVYDKSWKGLIQIIALYEDHRKDCSQYPGFAEVFHIEKYSVSILSALASGNDSFELNNFSHKFHNSNQ